MSNLVVLPSRPSSSAGARTSRHARLMRYPNSNGRRAGIDGYAGEEGLALRVGVIWYVSTHFHSTLPSLTSCKWWYSTSRFAPPDTPSCVCRRARLSRWCSMRTSRHARLTRVPSHEHPRPRRCAPHPNDCAACRTSEALSLRLIPHTPLAPPTNCL